MSTNSNINKNIENVKKSDYVVKNYSRLIGLKINSDSFDFSSNKGSINLSATSLNEDIYFDINLGTSWLFIFSELIDLYNKIGDIDFYSHQWILEKNKYRNSLTHKFVLTYNSNQETVLTIADEKEKTLSIVFSRHELYELIIKIIEIIQKIKNFKFSFINLENDLRKLAIAKIDNKFGTIITTYNGIQFGKPYLSESDKYQIKYSSIHRILYGRWLSVHAERINISVLGVITTVDEEYVLDKNEKNKSSLAAIVLLASLSFKELSLEE